MKLNRFQPTIKYIEEPQIEVGQNVGVPEPKMGLTLLGPLGANTTKYEINIGLIGDSESIEKTKNLVERLNVTTYGKDKSFLHVDFPGLEKLRIKFNIKRTAEIDGDSLKQKIENTRTFSDRIELVGSIVGEKIRAIMDVEPMPDVLILAYPEVVDEYCIRAAVGQRTVPRKTSLEKIIEKTRAKNQTLDRFFGLPPPSVSYRPVVHKTSRFTDDEKNGFQEGAKEIEKLDLIAFGTRDIKLLRWGQQSPIRGTVVRLPDKSILLYTFGYIPYLNVYPGPRVPSPLEILEHHGNTSIDVICKEILALTKLNWNSAKFCIKAPITISFAKRVGFFLRNAPPTLTPKNKFKFYM
jgi:hypothetical protein